MDLFITSIKGKLVQNNKVLKNTELFSAKEKYIFNNVSNTLRLLKHIIQTF